MKHLACAAIFVLALFAGSSVAQTALDYYNQGNAAFESKNYDDAACRNAHSHHPVSRTATTPPQAGGSLALPDR